MAFSVILHAETHTSEYAMKLSDGTVISFESLKRHGEFVYLVNPKSQAVPYNMPNGIDVRVEHIVWVVETKAKA